MATQWPLVYARLLALLPTLSGWNTVKVIDGPPVDDNTTGLYCTVGHVDIPSQGQSVDSGTFTTQRTQDGGRIVEAGDVKCQLVAQEQRNDLPAARAVMFPLADAFVAAVAADYRLGVLSPDGSSSLTYQVVQQQTASGPFVTLVFTFNYSTITQ